MTPPTKVVVQRSAHGPFESISLRQPDPTLPAQLSVYRHGDTLVDAGSTHLAAALVDALCDTPPARIVCTHQHEDHVGGVGPLRAAFGHIPVYVPMPFVELLKTFDEVPPYRAAYWGHPEPILDAIGFLPGEIPEVPELQAVETPGHTPGHVALVTVQEGQRFVLSGDLYLGTQPDNFFWESAADDAIASCRMLAAQGDALTLLPAHGRARADGARCLLQLADNLERLQQQVLGASERLGTRDYWRLAAEVFGRRDRMAAMSSGQISNACFVRAVLDPVRTLPATPLAPRPIAAGVRPLK